MQLTERKKLYHVTNKKKSHCHKSKFTVLSEQFVVCEDLFPFPLLLLKKTNNAEENA